MGLTDRIFRPRAAGDREAIARAVLALWRQVAGGFRDDERTMEGAEFAERTAALAEEVARLGDRTPEPALLRRMLAALVPLLAERVLQLHARIDELAATSRAHDREHQVLALASSWQSDELERCRAMLTEALQGRETVMPSAGADGTAPLVSQLLSLVLHIQVPPPRPQASIGKRNGTAAHTAPPRRATASEPEPIGDQAMIAKALREILDGTAQAPKLARALEDQDLARRIADLAAEHRIYRAILQRIGVLPKN